MNIITERALVLTKCFVTRAPHVSRRFASFGHELFLALAGLAVFTWSVPRNVVSDLLCHDFLPLAHMCTFMFAENLSLDAFSFPLFLCRSSPLCCLTCALCLPAWLFRMTRGCIVTSPVTQHHASSAYLHGLLDWIASHLNGVLS